MAHVRGTVRWQSNYSGRETDWGRVAKERLVSINAPVSGNPLERIVGYASWCFGSRWTEIKMTEWAFYVKLT